MVLLSFQVFLEVIEDDTEADQKGLRKICDHYVEKGKEAEQLMLLKKKERL